jgi:hypothetical protein
MIGIAAVEQTETDLSAGQVTCPACHGPLQPWGHALTLLLRDAGVSPGTESPAASTASSSPCACFSESLVSEE